MKKNIKKALDKKADVKGFRTNSIDSITAYEKAQITKIRNQILNAEKIGQQEIIELGTKVNQLRPIWAQYHDSKIKGKKVLPLTKAGLLRWASNPGKYDLPGVDAPLSSPSTVTPKLDKGQKTIKSSSKSFFWDKLWNG
jgi:hypothetical protein